MNRKVRGGLVLRHQLGQLRDARSSRGPRGVRRAVQVSFCWCRRLLIHDDIDVGNQNKKDQIRNDQNPSFGNPGKTWKNHVLDGRPRIP